MSAAKKTSTRRDRGAPKGHCRAATCKASKRDFQHTTELRAGKYVDVVTVCSCTCAKCSSTAAAHGYRAPSTSPIRWTTTKNGGAFGSGAQGRTYRIECLTTKAPIWKRRGFGEFGFNWQSPGTAGGGPFKTIEDAQRRAEQHERAKRGSLTPPPAAAPKANKSKPAKASAAARTLPLYAEPKHAPATSKKKKTKELPTSGLSIVREMVLCGKANCIKLHGPYWYGYSTVYAGGRAKRRKHYIGKELPPTLRARRIHELETREQRPWMGAFTREQKAELRELRLEASSEERAP